MTSIRPLLWPAIPLTLTLTLLVVATGGPLAAQQREPMRLEGTLEGLQPGYLQVATREQGTWTVRVEAPARNINYSADADLGWLRPGAFVRFSASFNEQGQVETPLTDVTVITPIRDETRFGVFPQGTGLDLGELFADPDAPARRPPEYSPYLVCGRVAGIPGRQLVVQAGTIAVRVDLAENVRVALELAEYGLARPGDRVELSGWHWAGQPGTGIAQRLRITAAEPLVSEPSPAEQRRRRTARPSPARQTAPLAGDETDAGSP